MRFCLYRAFINNLPTKTNLINRSMNIDTICNFCQLHAEDIDHLFFRCSFSSFVWNWSCAILNFNGVNLSTLKDCILYLNDFCKGKNQFTDLVLLVFSTIVWILWNQRNYRIFGGKILNKQETCNEIINTVRILMIKTKSKERLTMEQQRIINVWSIDTRSEQEKEVLSRSRSSSSVFELP